MSVLEWFCAIEHQQKGPFSELEIEGLLKRRAIRDATLVWSSNMIEWAPLRETALARLVETKPSGPPPLPGFHASTVIPTADYIGFFEAIRICYSNFASARGRASRSEYWYFKLFVFFGAFCLLLACRLFGLSYSVSLPFLYIWILLTIPPSLACQIRRLHDIDRSGWWFFIIFVPLIGPFVMFFFLCDRGDPGLNRFG